MLRRRNFKIAKSAPLQQRKRRNVGCAGRAMPSRKENALAASYACRRLSIPVDEAMGDYTCLHKRASVAVMPQDT